MPNGDAVTTPIMHLADFLTESFLSCIKDKQENGAKNPKFPNSHKKKERKGQKERKEKYKEKKFIVNSFLLT